MPSPRPIKRLGPKWPATPDPLDEFLPESATEKELQTERPFRIREFLSQRQSDARPVEPDVAPDRTRLFTAAAVGAGLVVAVLVSALVVWPQSSALVGRSAPVVISESTVTFTSSPDGAGVYIDGRLAGKTPLSLSLPVGAHVAEVRSGSASRHGSITVEAGKIATQHVDFGGSSATGALQITSDPNGAQVTIDGVLRGVTPLKVPEMAPGAHRVTVSSGRTSVDRTVEVSAGTTATVVVSVPVEVPSGFVTISAPIDLEVFAAGRLVGSGRSLSISLPAGQHTLEILDRSSTFRTQTTVTVPAGRSVAVNVPMPNGSLAISALPWAEVWVDGRAIGQTPIGNLSVSFGTHEVVWRHPEHGERRQVVLVNSTNTVRLGIDWTR